MQVDRHAKCFHPSPEIPYRLLVEILGGIRVADVRVAVDQRSLETELFDGPLQLVAGGAYILERHGGEARISLRIRRYDLRQIVVHFLCGLDRDRAVRNALNAWLRQ